MLGAIFILAVLACPLAVVIVVIHDARVAPKRRPLSPQVVARRRTYEAERKRVQRAQLVALGLASWTAAIRQKDRERKTAQSRG